MTSQLPQDFNQTCDAIKSLLYQPAYDDSSAGPVIVRLTWHSAGTYCAATDNGGSDGAGMRYKA
jgi:cytochrome c peroxidase